MEEDFSNSVPEQTKTEEILLEWTSSKLVKGAAEPRSVMWLWIAATLVAAYAVWQHQWILLAVVVAALAFWIIWRRADLGDTHVRMTDKGIGTDSFFWEYDKLGEYHIDNTRIPAVLMIRHKSQLMPDLRFELQGVEMDKADEVIGRFLVKSDDPNWREDVSDRMGL